ncbi:MAG: L,D-transpeptidase [Xanthobacteraceae bacterium]|nr:L,D-transpeptidase [Xanthobacteraceae bacterium]
MKKYLYALAVVVCTGVFGFGGAEPAAAAQSVSIANESVGTIIVRTAQRRLYLVTAPGRAISYPVGVGRAGKQWQGDSFIVSKRLRPAWSPPAEMKRERPRLPDVIPAGSPSNPMGAAALVLAHGEYAIHGTNNPGSIGGFVSFGCIRMHNRDILDLFERVSVGTRVVVTH